MSKVPEEFWRAVEAIHSVVYFAPDDSYAGLGLRGFWRGYFASRAAALGTPGPELVTATFYGFAPGMVARAVPDVWALADREAVLAARSRLAASTLATAWPQEPTIADEVVALLDGLDLGGKPLAAAHLALPAPTSQTERLWHAVTVLRELHGDAHIAVLLGDRVDGCAANAWAVAAGLAPARLREVRGWSEAEWEQGLERLRGRGWVDRDDTLTESGRVARADVEARTHAVAEAALSEEARQQAVAVTEPLVALARAVGDAGLVPYPNPTAVERP
ncbi:hypothetical protein D9V37_04790 [Nocardioides mangrovicus]|uniref:SalK n=1 Tax=Nocardioides mangrovicus TaxID=2478913 RepID=A0A3L8P6V6_9ACTN|nr:hypothetical protein [Nocardioides mangrovicus]RLV50369.1 hypothetical protein D9V37_04790 [Nocardioides mangrovicus]